MPSLQSEIRFRQTSIASKSGGYKICSAGMVYSRDVETQEPSTFMAGHDNVSLTIIADHFAHIPDMDDGNTSFGEKRR